MNLTIKYILNVTHIVTTYNQLSKRIGEEDESPKRENGTTQSKPVTN